jgi:hypothetical protein
MEITALLRDFGQAVEKHDGKRFATLFCEDAIYHDVFYGVFTGKPAIAELVDVFYRDAAEFRWSFHDPCFDGRLLYARYIFSYRSLLPEAQGKRATFEGVAIMKLRENGIAEYREVANAGTSFIDMNFAPERIVKILTRQADALKARPEALGHLE